MLSELVFYVATILLSTAEPLRPEASVPFRVVAHRSAPVESLTRAQLSAIFMRRTRSWPDGTEIRPVEPSARSRVRERFSHAVHGKSVAYVTRYWHRVIFAGRGVPPLEVAGDAAVLDFVKNNRGAIGYIEGNAPPGDVKVLAVRP